MTPGNRRGGHLGWGFYALAFSLGPVWHVCLRLFYLDDELRLETLGVDTLFGPGAWFVYPLFGAAGMLTARLLAAWILKSVGPLGALCRAACLHLLGGALCASLLLLASSAWWIAEHGVRVSDLVTFLVSVVFLAPAVSLVVSVPTLPLGLPLGLFAVWALRRAVSQRGERPASRSPDGPAA